MASIYNTKKELEEALRKDLYSGFVEQGESGDFKPRLVVNKQNVSNVWDAVCKELEECDSFLFNVAFITDGALDMLKSTLLDLSKRGAHGKLLTGDFNHFNKPKVFDELLKIKNLDVRVYQGKNLHSKGYIFKKQENYSLLVGSANLTENALKVNTEWTLLVNSTNSGSIISDTLEEFEQEWSQSIPLTDEWIHDVYEPEFLKYEIKRKEVRSIGEQEKISPNEMQKEAMQNLAQLRHDKQTRALLISATATGKTYLSAFDTHSCNPKRVLFIAHRERLLKAAMKSFKRIYEPEVTMGLLTGSQKDFDSDVLFASIHMLHKEEILQEFQPDDFDYIVVDEAHHVGAKIYQRVLDYFKPKFLLGMTATPDRTGDDFDVYQAFDHNIAYEIRLKQAMEYGFVCPFHYFGVSDFTIDGVVQEDEKRINYLTAEERVKNIMETANYYGSSGKRVKGLIFVSRIDEAEELAKKFNEKGWKVECLSGSNSDDEREEAIDRLETDEGNNKLDYIISVDIFNEGVDIPQVNQIIMLRPTQSAIIFVQQLGRGLRKSEGKDYVNVIDFIGNYKSSFLVPVAFSGNNSYDKDEMRKFMSESSVSIPGSSTIEFDKVTRERIYTAINNAHVNRTDFLKAEYRKLKQKVGYIPLHTDFQKYEAISLQIIIKKYDSYCDFLFKFDSEDYKETFMKLTSGSESPLQFIRFVSREFSNGKRSIESDMIQQLILNPAKTWTIKDCNKQYQAALNYLAGDFFTDVERKAYQSSYFLKKTNGVYSITEKFKDCLQNPTFVATLKDLLEYTINNYEKDYASGNNSFVIGKKYTRKDACWMLNWPSNAGSTLYGYQMRFNTLPIFVTLDKKKDITASTQYEEGFVNPHILRWKTRSNRTTGSNEIQAIIDYTKKKGQVDLFVKKSDDEGISFYYLGKGTLALDTMENQKIKDDNGKLLDIVEVEIHLDTSVEPSLYHYLVSTAE